MIDVRIATHEDLTDYVKRANMSDYVRKGLNGTWGDVISLATDLYNPTRLTYYQPTTQNKPQGSSYGAAISFGSRGHLRKDSRNWIYTLAFSIDKKIFLTQSINGGQDSWVAIPTASVALHTIKVTGTTPAVGSSVTIPVSDIADRNRVASTSVRVDFPSSAVCLNCPIEIIADSSNSNRVTDVKFTNLTEYNVPQGSPFTIFITFER